MRPFTCPTCKLLTLLDSMQKISVDILLDIFRSAFCELLIFATP
jgi:hypothetical protein